jgi:hypothetical protein
VNNNKQNTYMNTEQKSKGMAFVIPGLLLEIGCLYARRITGEPQWLSLAFAAGSLVGLILLIIGLRQFAKSKGYSDAYDFLGLLSLLGVLITAVLPDKTKV